MLINESALAALRLYPDQNYARQPASSVLRMPNHAGVPAHERNP
jgi:hypothetical protein